ncbi:hypothetical protein J4Q44_G00290310 [Coregonus suidteri]|uniref:Pyrin domain-containing protein n=1 Tax=Coregonus suidteri TaxID=861788 RepID=A0AAN8QKH4_9TELE
MRLTLYEEECRDLEAEISRMKEKLEVLKSEANKDEQFAKLPSTSSGRLTPSEEECRDLETEISSLEELRFMKFNKDEKFATLPRTSSYGRLTPSEEECLDLEAEISWLKDYLRFMKIILDVAVLLLTTLGKLTGEQLKTFQSKLTSVQLPGFPPIPESQLENADRQDTVDQMVKTYGPEIAVEITLMILRKMDQNDLAEKLKRDYNRALLLATLEELTEEQLKTFQSKLTSVQLPGFPPIPESQLENADRQDTVDQMVERYDPEGAVKITLMILKRMNQHDLAKKLQRDHRGSPLFLEHHHMSSPDEFTPEIHDQDNRGEYRFQCPSAGLFQCSITGLVFRMEGEGEVLYRTVPWNRRLLAQSGKRPAGPLFKFTCLKGSVCQLHLPHCEIYNSGLPCDFLSVAHVTDENMEFIRPHKITETHVIIKISGFSAYGDVKDEDSPTVPIRALVLLFYKPPVVPKKRSILNVLLLPRNVVIREVQDERKTRNGDKETFIETTPHCNLTPNKTIHPLHKYYTWI